MLTSRFGRRGFAITAVPTEDPISVGDWYSLSDREEDVFIGLWLGKTDGEVASDLGISIGTVRQYKRRLQTKVGADRPSGIISAALRNLPHVDASH
jgi:DNA-binding CsgD family transcriptional regulator